MRAAKLLELARYSEPDDEIIVEVEGYELEVYAVESDEYEGTLVIKAVAADGEDGPGLPWADDDEEGEADGDPGWGRAAEQPLETLEVDGPAPKEG